MKRTALLLFLTILLAAGVRPLIQANDYVDDAYHPLPTARTTQKAVKQGSKQATPAPQQEETKDKTPTTEPAGKKQQQAPERVQFLQVTDTVVKAIIRR